MLELFSYFRSSSTHRVRIALELKKVPYKHTIINLLKDGGEQHTDTYKKLNPMGEVPFLKINPTTGIGQSMAIIEYLDEMYPDPTLLPADPILRAKVRQVAENVNAGIQPYQNLGVLQMLGKKYGVKEADVKAWAQHWIKRGLSAIETLIKPKAGKFSFGDIITIADLYIVPQMFSAQRFEVSTAEFPTLERVFASSMMIDAFIKADPFHQPDTPADLKK